ncbi:MAG: hypothetical protein FAZ92_03371 [Accumulibacter sp.]|jgi:hypothetical protein|nr:MAG: hypothetical protein FAZ92_03371 [Accumulibacter sp.]
MKSARPTEAKTSALEPRPDFITVRLQAGEIVGARDYPESDRPLFWSAIASIRDALPCVRPFWRTIHEEHVDGLRTRQKFFRICPRQKGGADPTLISLIAMAVTCMALIVATRWPL